MDNLIEQFLASAKSVSLTEEERSEVKSKLFAEPFKKGVEKLALSRREKRKGLKAFKRYIRANPVYTQSISFVDLINRVLGSRLISLSLAACILISASGGIAYAAEDSLPGELLYPVKVNLTEPFRERMHRNPDTRARWAEKRLKRRLTETETVLSTGNVSEERMERMRQRINFHKAHLENAIQNLPRGIPVEIRQHMEKRMQEHIDFLDAVEKGEVTVKQVEIVRPQVKKHRIHIQMIRQRPQMQRPGLHNDGARKGNGKRHTGVSPVF